jgi:Cu/Ag efflux protein CusF
MQLSNLLAAVLLAATAVVQAQSGAASGADRPAHPPAGAAAPEEYGEVRRIDREQAKLTLRHGPLKSLDMPAMTMVSDPKLLEGLKEGDKVRFTARKIDGAYTVTALQAAP